MRYKSTRLLLSAGLLALAACSNPFAPEKKPGPGDGPEPAPAATTPQQLMDNLHRAMRDRDEQLYETLLDEDFWFTETDCQGSGIQTECVKCQYNTQDPEDIDRNGGD